ncbi:MAG TPA: acyl-CoA dehydrogenase family protein [Longimicrobiaceae bacterium]
MTFRQTPPELGNEFDNDRVLRSLLHRLLPEDVRRAVEPELREMGELAGGKLYRMQLADRLNEPRLTHWDAWGNRIDEITLTPLWREAERIAVEKGVVATAYEQAHGPFSRIHQFALAYLFTPSTDMYSCPLAMTDGAARTLLDSGTPELIERTVPHLVSRDPTTFWTSGQWMTEASGGSDVGETETVARPDGDRWRLYGLKWFTSAATSQLALALARPEGAPPGSRGLTLFCLETRDEQGRLAGIRVRRLKDKLGTRKLPTAELELDGVEAVPVGEMGAGVRSIVPLLSLTRTWNAVSACAYMGRGIALARDYAGKRVAFRQPLSEHPLHLDTLATLQAEFEGAMNLTFRLVELLGKAETGEATEEEARLLRLLTPIAKLLTARQAVTVTSECLEAHGGAGYIEDTGLPYLLRDAQVLTIWEGTTNVLALDVLRALDGGPADPARREIRRCEGLIHDPALRRAAKAAVDWLDAAEHWRDWANAGDHAELYAGARRYALALGRALEVALTAAHAQWSIDVEGDRRAAAAATRLSHAVPPLLPPALPASRALALDLPLDRP